MRFSHVRRCDNLVEALCLVTCVLTILISFKFLSLCWSLVPRRFL